MNPLPDDKVISNNGISRVWLGGDGYIYKQQPKYLTDNEIWGLERMYQFGYAPKAEQVGIETVRMEYILRNIVTDRDKFMYHYAFVLKALKDAGIRHGDLSEYSVLVRDNTPILIDFAESRVICDPRPDKRPEGDRYWLGTTMVKLCG